MTKSRSENVVYLPGLNGLRAIAAILVLIGHVTIPMYSDFSRLVYQFHPGFDGVTLFFVISGFLITFLLLKEKKKTNDIDIKKFYIRRILRIWPIYYLFIISCLILALFFNKIQSIYSFELVYYIFFAANVPFILQIATPILTHYWSIGVEEQFYLFWPWFIKLVKNKIVPMTIVFFCFLFIIKLGARFILGKEAIIYKVLVVSRFHCMLIGALGAMLFVNKNILFLKFFTNKWIHVFAWLIFILLSIEFVHIPAPIAPEITSLVSLFLIVGQINASDSKKIINLEHNVFDFLGKISYGIYVIHPLVIMILFYFLDELIVSKLIYTMKLFKVQNFKNKYA